MKFDNLSMELLNTITDLTQIPDGAVNIRVDGESIVRNSSAQVTITSREDGRGFSLVVKPGTQETIHVPVLITQAGIQETVYNTFNIGENSDITIIAGCGIHNPSHSDSKHDGVHEFVVGTGARLRYVEKHMGQGSGQGKRIMNPTTRITLHSGASAELEMTQIKGVDDTHRSTIAYIEDKATLKIVERLMTEGDQVAESDVKLNIVGKGGSGQIISRSVARDTSVQVFRASLLGQVECNGHVECDSIIMDKARISSIPELVAEDSEAVLTHEAAIGKIAGEQLIKLMSLGLMEQEAVDIIIDGFLR
ncbi:MAG: SufD family Fe-S cluster assembly protein [Syntrophomonadaceae bacterium]|jgi:Fe-S cluster assembly scaffold protein SufB|nr:SufD family Fe-S cluster assembly protein [Syntrophomonadaceae bacterium]